MREVKFSQTHRTTGTPRRFIISQCDPAADVMISDPGRNGPYLPAPGPLAWRYIAQVGHGTPWTELRWIDAKPDAPDEEIRKKAIRDFNHFGRERAQF